MIELVEDGNGMGGSPVSQCAHSHRSCTPRMEVEQWFPWISMTALGKCRGMNWVADALNVEQIDRETTHGYTLPTLPTLLSALSPVQSGRVSNEDARSLTARSIETWQDRPLWGCFWHSRSHWAPGEVCSSKLPHNPSAIRTFLRHLGERSRAFNWSTST